MKEKNDDYKTMCLPDILDLYSKFHYVIFKEPEWSVVDWVLMRCMLVCVLIRPSSACSSLQFSVYPTQTGTSVRKSVMLKRGIAGSKRKRWLAAKALKNEKLFVQALACRWSKGTLAHSYSFRFLYFVAHTLVHDAAPVPEDTRLRFSLPTPAHTHPSPLTPPPRRMRYQRCSASTVLRCNPLQISRPR